MTTWRAPRFGVGAALGALFALTPSVLAGASWALGQPLLTTHFRCGTADMGLPFLAAIAMLGGCVVALPVSAFVSSRAARLNRAAMVLAAALVTVAVLVIVAALASWRRPQPDDFGRLYDHRVALDVGKTVRLGDVDVDYEPTPFGSSASETCHLHVAGPHGTRDEPVWAPEHVCPALEVVEGSNMPAVVVRRGTQVDESNLIAIEPGGELGVRDIASRVGAPHGWIVSSILGVVLAGLALARASASRRRRKVLEGTVEARHDGGGWVVVDGASRHVATLARAPAGPVMVRVRESRPSTYRDDAGPDVVLAWRGSRAEAIDATRARATAWALVAVSVTAFACAPLCAARVFGIL